MRVGFGSVAFSCYSSRRPAAARARSPIMVKMYQGGGMPGMGDMSGMPGMSGMSGGGPHIEEVD
jgi:hypothetical protein